jgi:hypothetical protein
MKTKNPITVLLENGIHFSTLTNMSENQIKILAERFKKEESKEAITKTTTSTYTIDPTTAKTTGADIGRVNVKVEPSGAVKATEIKEKFESKAQQGLFWAKCNNAKGKEKKKWCDMAKEFSDSTTKKDYKKMPEKIHPEKTVDYKKKAQKESYEKFLEDRIVEMVHNHVNPKLTKGEIKKTIQEKSESMMLRNPKRNTMFSKNEGMEMKKMGKPIGRMFSAGKTPMEENDTKEKERTKEKEPGTKNPPKRRGNPFKNPNPGVKEQPRGNSKDDVKMTFMNQIKQALK